MTSASEARYQGTKTKGHAQPSVNKLSCLAETITGGLSELAKAC